MNDLTLNSKALLFRLIAVADYENDETGMQDALVTLSKEEKGNLTDLKKKGYLTTLEEGPKKIWIIFEEKAREAYGMIHK